MTLAAVFEDGDKLVPGAVERTHTGVVLDPDAEVFQLAVDPAADGQQVFDMTPVHEQIMQRAIDAEGREVATRLVEKGGEFGPIHLARGHRERAMMDRAETAHVTFDRQVVGRVGEHHRGRFVAQQRSEGLGVECIPAQDAMGTQDPQIPELAERCAGRKPPHGRELVHRWSLGYRICRIVIGPGQILE